MCSVTTQLNLDSDASLLASTCVKGGLRKGAKIDESMVAVHADRRRFMESTQNDLAEALAQTVNDPQRIALRIDVAADSQQIALRKAHRIAPRRHYCTSRDLSCQIDLKFCVSADRKSVV